MRNPNTRRDCCLSSAAFEGTELKVGKGANHIRAVPSQNIRSSGTRRLSPSGRWGERRNALSRFTPSPTINSARSIAGEFRLTSSLVFGVQMENRL
jgi:hypothetical protein